MDSTPSTTTSRTPRSDDKVSLDPFKILPYDVKYEIFTHLTDPTAVLALCKASWPINEAVRVDNKFWRRILHSAMPWLWELLGPIMEANTYNSEALENVDWKGLFLWAERVTRPERGLEGPFMGPANRRRVWNVCEQLAALYVPKFIAQEQERAMESEGTAIDEVAARIWDTAENLILPVTAFPMLEEGVKTATKQWVRSFDEIGAGNVVFEAIWDAEGSLVGLSMTLSGTRRLFGKDTEGGLLKSETMIVNQGQWITGLVLHLPSMSLEHHPPGRLRHTINWKEENLMTSIKGPDGNIWSSVSFALEVMLTNFEVITSAGYQQLGDTDPQYCQRVLNITEGKTLVGIVGHLGSVCAFLPFHVNSRYLTSSPPQNGTIARLGLVQAPRHTPSSLFSTTDDYDIAREYPLLQRMLWKPIPSLQPFADIPGMWAYPGMRALPYTSDTLNRYQIQASIHEDLVPTEALIWGATLQEMRALRQLVCYQRREGKQICGLRAVFEKESGIAPRTIGNGTAVGEEGVEEMGGEWPDRDIVVLNIDGASGEEVSDVQVMHDEAIKAITVSYCLWALICLYRLNLRRSGRIEQGQFIGVRRTSIAASLKPLWPLLLSRLSVLLWDSATKKGSHGPEIDTQVPIRLFAIETFSR